MIKLTSADFKITILMNHKELKLYQGGSKIQIKKHKYIILNEENQLWIGALGDQQSMCLNHDLCFCFCLPSSLPYVLCLFLCFLLSLFLLGLFISSLRQLAWDKRLCCCIIYNRFLPYQLSSRGVIVVMREEGLLPVPSLLSFPSPVFYSFRINSAGASKKTLRRHPFC